MLGILRTQSEPLPTVTVLCSCHLFLIASRRLRYGFVEKILDARDECLNLWKPNVRVRRHEALNGRFRVSWKTEAMFERFLEHLSLRLGACGGVKRELALWIKSPHVAAPAFHATCLVWHDPDSDEEIEALQ